MRYTSAGMTRELTLSLIYRFMMYLPQSTGILTKKILKWVKHMKNYEPPLLYMLIPSSYHLRANNVYKYLKEVHKY